MAKHLVVSVSLVSVSHFLLALLTLVNVVLLCVLK